ncbi:MAG: hypothetical protein U5L09_03565 [Bacteroidales bacterium]|nr:hypothetical protein [Bacteroidales bacterium]
MKPKDILFLLLFSAIFVPFFVLDAAYEGFLYFNHHYPLLMSFFKFALLATVGEALGLRIKAGVYNRKGFGLLPRAFVWGVIGLSIKLAFTVFLYRNAGFSGKPVWDFQGAQQALAGPLSFSKIAVAFAVSTAMNLIFAPVMMTFHKITDTHILNNGGTLRGFFSPLPLGNIIKNLNWEVQYHFVFKKTIPLFWIPAHTITFLLPVDFQVLFAALLGIMLGVILAIASLMSR